jgi:hypothetical protein
MATGVRIVFPFAAHPFYSPVGNEAGGHGIERRLFFAIKVVEGVEYTLTL